MNRRGGPPSQLPTLTEVVGDAAPPPGFVTSTSGARLLDEALRDAPIGEAGKDPTSGAMAAADLRTGVRIDVRTDVRVGADRRTGLAASPADIAAVGAPPIRQALTRKPRAPLVSTQPAGAGSQLPLLGVPFDAVHVSLDAAPASGAGEPGLGADIFEGAGQSSVEAGDDQLVRAVLQDLQRHVDLMLEYRLRASLTPVLTQMADSLVRELRQELASTLRDVVKRAVSQELVRRRKR
jgi:hypothetical protein